MGGLNLEVAKFGMYVMFPIGIMYYFGTNLDSRFAVPNFWPKPENSNRVPFERDEIQAELARLRARRLNNRDRRWDREEADARAKGDDEGLQRIQEARGSATQFLDGAAGERTRNAAAAAAANAGKEGQQQRGGWGSWKFW